MLFKLSLKNMEKSLKDYAIYFLTLVLGVAIFYMFNSLDSQEAMLQVSASTKQIIKLMIEMLGLVSVFVAIVLALLIVYANRFLINRRKKEFGIYMTLGMGKRQISKIILLETLFVGIFSLVIGLVIGVFGSQLMSILVAKLFEADLSGFTFIFSTGACIKTMVYFAIMYLAVMFLNTITISRYQLIDLIYAEKKNESIKAKNPILSILVFLIAAGLLGYCYYKVTLGVNTLNSAQKTFPIIGMGILATILVFWSLSGLILRMIQSMKKVYLKNTNIFVLRQINHKINTNVISMSVICLMLFMTITILSSALSFRNSLQKDLLEMTPVDINLYKTANLPEKYVTKSGKEIVYTPEQIADSHVTIQETLETNGMDMQVLKDMVEIPIYGLEDITLKSFLGSSYEESKQEFPFLNYEKVETIIKISDYNQIAKLYGNPTYSLAEDEYIVLCDYQNMENIRNRALQLENSLTIMGKSYTSQFSSCQSGYIWISTSHTNAGILLVPDSCPLPEEAKEQTFLAANYRGETEEEKREIEEYLVANGNGFLSQIYAEQKISIDGSTRISIIESSVGLTTIVTFIAIYLGIIFLIASAAILALKQLTESSDNRQRYLVLRKIGVDEKMISRSLFCQIGIFFGMPLILAMIHSIFGIQFALSVLSAVASSQELLPSIIATVLIMGGIYGIYFMATYFGCKNIVKE